jgi:hypothetical protein
MQPPTALAPDQPAAPPDHTQLPDEDGTFGRNFDARTGELLPLAEERAETAEGLLDDARRRLNDETERAENERKRADKAEGQRQRLAEKLRALGIDPEA